MKSIVVRDVGQPPWFVRLILALILACVGCSYVPPRAFVTDGFTRSQHEALERAASKWNGVLRQPLSLEGGSWTIVPQTPPDFESKGYVGETVHGTRTIYLAPWLDEERFYVIALHELGHVAGLHHIAGSGVMNPNGYAVEFTPGDIEECQRVGACGLSEIDAAKCRLQGACD